MHDLTSEDQRHLEHAEGWLGLGNHLEANAALDRITPALRARPVVLELRYKVFVIGQHWEGAAEIARASRTRAPLSNKGPSRESNISLATVGCLLTDPCIVSPKAIERVTMSWKEQIMEPFRPSERTGRKEQERSAHDQQAKGANKEDRDKIEEIVTLLGSWVRSHPRE